MNEIVECADRNVTTYRKHYVPFTAEAAARNEENKKNIENNKKQFDELVISGYNQQNLLVNDLRLRSKVWPRTDIGKEEYTDFIKRLESCKEEIHKIYYNSPDVNIPLIEKMLLDLEKSVYQMSYSPNEYESINWFRRFGKSNKEPTGMPYEETTYRVYYNRIREFDRFKDVMSSVIKKRDDEKYRCELRKVLKTGRSTYHETICVPAMFKTKQLKNVPSGPIDRYTLRKV